VVGGSVIAQSYHRRRHQKFLRFRKVIDAAFPKTWTWAALQSSDRMFGEPNEKPLSAYMS
jgi:hypothetical protein